MIKISKYKTKLQMNKQPMKWKKNIKMTKCSKLRIFKCNRIWKCKDKI